jgi:hypothetical protein
VAAGRIAALPMKEDRSEEIKPYAQDAPLPIRISIEPFTAMIERHWDGPGRLLQTRERRHLA